MCTVANKQGGIREESGTALTEQATGRSTACFSASEIDVLGEQELQSRCISHLFVFKNIRNYPRVRKKKRLVTPGVPARLDRHYASTTRINTGLGVSAFTLTEARR